MKKKILISCFLLFFILAPIMLFGCINDNNTDPDNNTPPPTATAIKSVEGLADEYLLNEPFENKNKSTNSIKITYNNNTTENVTVADIVCDLYSSTTYGIKGLLVTYKGMSTTFTYEIKCTVTNFTHNFPTNLRYKQLTNTFTCSFNYNTWDTTNNIEIEKNGTINDIKIGNLTTDTLGSRTATFEFGGNAISHDYNVYYMQDDAAVNKIHKFSFKTGLTTNNYVIKLENFKIASDKNVSGKVYIYEDGETWDGTSKACAYLYLGKLADDSSISEGLFYIYHVENGSTKHVVALYNSKDNTLTFIANTFSLKPGLITWDNTDIVINLS